MGKKYLIPGMALGMMCLLADSCFAAGTLKVGVRDDIVNLGYLNPDTGQYYGFEIDLAAEMAKNMGYSKVEYVSVKPEDRETKLENGEVDCVLAAFSITEERQEKFDFSPAYYEDVSGIVVENSSLIETMEGLVGQTIGGLEGTNTEEELKEKMVEKGLITEQDVKGTSFQYCSSYEELITRLEEGSLDAVCMDGCIAQAYMDEESRILEENISTQDYGAATIKGSDLSEKVSKSIQKLLDDGTVDELKDKWD